MKKSRVIFNKSAFRKELTVNLTALQTQLLVDYAKGKIVEIGDMISTYHSKHNMDRTGALLNSLCWGVSYNGDLQDYGFYRQAVNKSYTKRGGDIESTSYLHEWMSGDVKYLIPVEGHSLALNYLNKYGNNGGNGWKVFFAILAPYWGYWEKGFTLKSNFGGGSQHLQFAVMSQFYDEVKKDLKPARTRFRVSVAKYDRAKLEKKWEKFAFKH